MTLCRVLLSHVAALRQGRMFPEPGGNMELRNRPRAWLHFGKKGGENTAVCDQGNTVISCGGANTSNMQKLLSTQHGIKLQECVRPGPANVATVAAASSTGLPCVDSLEKKIKRLLLL